MKNIFTLLIIILISVDSLATIRRVNNNAGVSAPYTSAQAANDATVNGDTILLEGSSTSYGNLTSSKQLTWIGTGYFLNQTSFPQWNQNSAKIGTFNGVTNINFGSSNSRFIGFEIVGSFNISAPNIAISKCLFITSNGNIKLLANSDNFTVRQCFFNIPNGAISITGSASVNVDNILISNNYFNYYYYNGLNYSPGAINLNSNYSGVSILNNIISGTVFNPISIGFGLVKNNIINNQSGNSTFTPNSNNVTNNIFMNQTNTNYVDINGNIFISENMNSNNSVLLSAASQTSDTWMKLKAGSPAFGAGEGGIDIGALGGNTPYIFQGIPPLPTISTFQANSTPGNLLPCLISTRSNN